jgi:hypothetical protein
MGKLISFGKSGGGSLYIKLGRSFSVERDDTETILSTKIKKVTLKVFYDFHATAGFTFDEILHDFWGKIETMCEEEFLEWRDADIIRKPEKFKHFE